MRIKGFVVGIAGGFLLGEGIYSAQPVFIVFGLILGIVSGLAIIGGKRK